jgi:hypothetical protein
LKDKIYSSNTQKEEELKENIRRTASEVKSKLLPPVQGVSTHRGTTFSTPPVICDL